MDDFPSSFMYMLKTCQTELIPITNWGEGRRKPFYPMFIDWNFSLRKEQIHWRTLLYLQTLQEVYKVTMANSSKLCWLIQRPGDLCLLHPGPDEYYVIHPISDQKPYWKGSRQSTEFSVIFPKIFLEKREAGDVVEVVQRTIYIKYKHILNKKPYIE